MPRLNEGAKKETLKPGEKPHADNTACLVCHGNYQDEPLAQWHAAANIGCVKCHGVSTAHRNDEDHRTPPDIMYATEDIDRACEKCHATHDAPARKVLARWQEKCPAKTHPRDIVCTDCHGEHRLKFRSYWWDKKTVAHDHAEGREPHQNGSRPDKEGNDEGGRRRGEGGRGKRMMNDE